MERELSTMRKRDGELDVVFKRVYEDSALGRVSNEQFRLLSEAYSKHAPQKVHICFRDFNLNETDDMLLCGETTEKADSTIVLPA